jgi:hypothetical protein
MDQESAQQVFGRGTHLDVPDKRQVDVVVFSDMRNSRSPYSHVWFTPTATNAEAWFGAVAWAWMETP